MYQVSLIFFYFFFSVLKVEMVLVSRWEEIGKGWRGKAFQHMLFRWNILTIMWCHRTLSIFWCLGGKGSVKGKRDKEIILKSTVTQWRNVFSICFLFPYRFSVVQWSQGMVRFKKILDVILFGLFQKWSQILVVLGIFSAYGFELSCLGKVECVFQL